MQLLLDNKASVNAADEDGHTPLHIAVQRQCLSKAQKLVEFGADPTLEFSTVFHGGVSAIKMAMDNEQHAMVLFLTTHAYITNPFVTALNLGKLKVVQRMLYDRVLDGCMGFLNTRESQSCGVFQQAVVVDMGKKFQEATLDEAFMTFDYHYFFPTSLRELVRDYYMDFSWEKKHRDLVLLRPKELSYVVIRARENRHYILIK